MTKITNRWLEITQNLDTDSNKVVNVSDGVDPKDAVNKSQLDSVAATAGERFQAEEFILTSGQVTTTKQVTLSQTPVDTNEVLLWIIGGIPQDNGVDYAVSGTILSWNGLGLDGLVAVGEHLHVVYSYAG